LSYESSLLGFFTDDKRMMQVMLLGHSDSYVKDKAMQVTIAFNHFGEGLIQRMPR
jgi:pectate lyase